MTKLVLRLLNAAGDLLAWTQVEAKVPGDGGLWAPGPTITFEPAEQTSEAASLSTHWCMVNVEVRVPLAQAIPVTAGQRVVIQPSGALVSVGPAAGGLPPVTVRAPVTVGVPMGVLASVGG